jgi:hypothetical protein
LSGFRPKNSSSEPLVPVCGQYDLTLVKTSKGRLDLEMLYSYIYSSSVLLLPISNEPWLTVSLDNLPPAQNGKSKYDISSTSLIFSLSSYFYPMKKSQNSTLKMELVMLIKKIYNIQ